MNQIKLFLIGLCFFWLVMLLSGCADMQPICPEIKVSFCPAN